jgi:hypothetical protein
VPTERRLRPRSRPRFASHPRKAQAETTFDALDASARALLGMAKAMLAAKAKNEDQVAASGPV